MFCSSVISLLDITAFDFSKQVMLFLLVDNRPKTIVITPIIDFQGFYYAFIY